MQTFLPYPDYRRSASVLDLKRLGKQRVECLQIINTLAGLSEGWQHHPAVRMWRGYESSLIDYGVSICTEWQDRGYDDTVRNMLEALRERFRVNCAPPWLGDDVFHRSHRSNLSRKLPYHYGRYWSEPTDLPYLWPDPMEYILNAKPSRNL
jgi:hypothetical protein